MLSGVSVLAAIATAIFQSYAWLRFGEWPKITPGTFLASEPTLSWVGVQKAVDWIYWDCPLSPALFCFGLLALFVMIHVEEG